MEEVGDGVGGDGREGLSSVLQRVVGKRFGLCGSKTTSLFVDRRNFDCLRLGLEA